MTLQVDWSLYLATDPDLAGGPDKVAGIAEEAVAGGVSVVQLRDKQATEVEFAERALQIRTTLANYPQVPIFVNDRFECAQKYGFHLHIGQQDMPYVQARKALPVEQMIGISIENMQQLDVLLAQCAAENLALPDVIGIGPVWDTPTKADAAKALGVSGTMAIAQRAQAYGIASVAIGGINQQTAFSITDTGISGLCVVSAIMCAESPRLAAQNLRTKL